MKKFLLPSILTLALTLGLAVPAFGAEEPAKAEVTVNAQSAYFSAEVYDGTAYIPFYGGVQLLRPDAEITWEEGTFYARAADFTMTVKVGDPYLAINDRYLYIPMRVKGWEDGTALVPARVLATALGAWVDWTGKVELCSGGVPLKAEDCPYDETMLDLMARVITHESGNQPLEGKMAVGNVILNRVNSTKFPNTVSEVIYSPNQFPGATNATPNAESILAARLVMEGANVVPGAYYFNGVGKPCWASRNKTLIRVIGGHAFYG